MAAARVIDGEVVTSLEDGRILKLPAERIARLFAVMDDLMDAAGRAAGETMVLDAAAAPGVLDLEDLVTTRWQEGAMIIEQVARFRAVSEIPEATVPAAVSPRVCGHISSWGSTGCSIYERTAWADCSRTIWGWARPHRRSLGRD